MTNFTDMGFALGTIFGIALTVIALSVSSLIAKWVVNRKRSL